VKLETGSLEIALVVCRLEKVTPVEKPLIRQSRVY